MKTRPRPNRRDLTKWSQKNNNNNKTNTIYSVAHYSREHCPSQCNPKRQTSFSWPHLDNLFKIFHFMYSFCSCVSIWHRNIEFIKDFFHSFSCKRKRKTFIEREKNNRITSFNNSNVPKLDLRQRVIYIRRHTNNPFGIHTKLCCIFYFQRTFLVRVLFEIHENSEKKKHLKLHNVNSSVSLF